MSQAQLVSGSDLANFNRPRVLLGIGSVCFVIPCFNEQDGVAATVESVRAAMTGDRDYEIVLVDDCSTDDTLNRMLALAEADPRIRVLHNEINLNFGGAYKRGVAAACADYVMMLPGDDGFPAESISVIVSLAGTADIIIPIVTNPGVRAWYRAIGSLCFTVVLNWLFWLHVGYYNGAVLQRRDLLQAIEIKTNSFAYQAEALVKLIARGASYSQCFVRINERQAGRSSALSLRNQIAVWKTITHLVAQVGLFRRVRVGFHRH